MSETKLREIVQRCRLKNLLLSPELIDEPELEKKILTQSVSTVITKDTIRITEKEVNVNWSDFETSRALYEKGLRKDLYKKFMDYILFSDGTAQPISQKVVSQSQSLVEIDFSYAKESKKRTIQDFILHFNVRFKTLEKILRQRQELQNIISINRLLNKKEKEAVALIGMVSDIKRTKNDNLMITLEDPTGSIRTLVSKSKPELYELAKDIVLDEVIGVLGTSADKIVFVNSILWPDIPLSHELKKSPDEVYSVFMGDTEFGCSLFMEKEFDRFLDWINGRIGTDEQKDIVQKIRYLFIVGDVVNGVGIYPNQEKSLAIDDIYKQYEFAAEKLKQIPSHIKIIICPGNHDAMRIAEPQPVFYKDLAAPLWDIDNVILVSNPALVTIHKKEDFPGFKVLLYHGFSFVYYADQIESLRAAGGISRSDLLMKFLLKRRHLAPTHTSNLYIPETEYDPMAITVVPDFFISGHVHTFSVSNYRNVTMLNCSCWVGKTPYQEKFGIEPQPGRILLTNLQTRAVKVMRF